MARPQVLGGKTRFTIDLDPDFDQMLTELAQAKGTTKADIIRRAVASYNFLERQTRLDGGGKVSITDQFDHVLKDIVLP